MHKTMLTALTLTLALASAAVAEEPRKLVFDIDFTMANINDNSLRWSMGRERVTKIAYAVAGLSGEINPNLTYRFEINAVDDTRRPAPFTPSDKTPFFFPNQADEDYGVRSQPEGQFDVDDYKHTGWDPYLQQQHLRRAFIDAHTESGRFGVVAGRFFVPIGLGLEDMRWFTAKDISHIQLINAVADTGAELYARFGRRDGLNARLSASVITGNGSPYHDYVYFDFTGDATEDTNSAVGGVITLRATPLPGLDVVGTAEYNLVGSRIESDTTLTRSKHYDNKYVFGASYRPPQFKTAQVFGQYAHYKWGLRDTAAEILPGPPTKSPIPKNGYLAGVDLGVPLPGKRGTAGVVFLHEELDRDDSLIAFLAAREQLGVALGAKQKSNIFKVYVELGPVSVYYAYNDLTNPYPQVSAIVPISGPFAFRSIGDAKTSIGFRLRTSF